MCQKFPFTVFIWAYFLCVTPVICDSCQNAFETFQKILQTRQQPGRFYRGRRISEITTHFVFTKMECLDTCLRTTECASFEVKVTRPDHNGSKEWVCVINLRPENKSLELVGKRSGWIHVNVSSQELEEVS